MLFRIVSFLIAAFSSYGLAHFVEHPLSAYGKVSSCWCFIGVCAGLAFAIVGNPERNIK